MPTVVLPVSLSVNGSHSWEVSSNSLQGIISELYSNSDEKLNRFRAFITKNEQGYQLNGLIVCLNNTMLSAQDFPIQAEDQITFIPAMSGG